MVRSSLPLLLCAGLALANDEASAAPRRAWGIGIASGAGFVVGGSTSVDSDAGLAVAAATKLPSVELALYFDSAHVLELELPLSNMIVTSMRSAGFCYASSAYFAFNLGRDRIRLRLGPGVGLDLLFVEGGTGAEVRLPALLAVELLNRKRTIGLRLMARPWVGFALGSGGNHSLATFGSLFEVGVYWYATRK